MILLFDSLSFFKDFGKDDGDDEHDEHGIPWWWDSVIMGFRDAGAWRGYRLVKGTILGLEQFFILGFLYGGYLSNRARKTKEN